MNFLSGPKNCRLANYAVSILVQASLEWRALMKQFLKTVLVVAICIFSAVASAQVYQWKDPENGATRISTIAPAWFRIAYGDQRNPRVQVFYYGVLVDDTGLAYEGRVAMRSRTYMGRYLPQLIPPTSQQVRR